jgi:hypothetical protein
MGNLLNVFLVFQKISRELLKLSVLETLRSVRLLFSFCCFCFNYRDQAMTFTTVYILENDQGSTRKWLRIRIYYYNTISSGKLAGDT